MVLDYQPAVSIFSQLLIFIDGYKDMSEFLADLHDKRNTSVERILFDLVDN